MGDRNGDSSSKSNGESDDPIDVVRQALLGLRYGSIEIVVHESKVVQIERKEKVRLVPASTTSRLVR